MTGRARLKEIALQVAAMARLSNIGRHMKVCPFCREEIRDDAIKCRYCSSSLLPPQPLPESSSATSALEPDRTVYVLDKDLIRFAKFVAAVLAIIIAVGVILYGIDIKQAAKDAEESAKNVRELANSMKDLQRAALDTRDAIQKDKEAVFSDRSDVEKQLHDMKEAESRTLKIAAELEGAKKEVIATEQQAKDLLVRAEQYVDSIAKDALEAHNETRRGGTEPTPTNPFQSQNLRLFIPATLEFPHQVVRRETHPKKNRRKE